MDFANLTLTGLVAIGVVNAIDLFKPGLDSRIKFASSFLVAFAVAFIPVELGNLIFQNAKLAVEAAFGASAVYKLATKMGGPTTE